MKKLVLYSTKEFRNLSPEAKEIICNGVGASFFPSWLVKALNSRWFCYGVSLRRCADQHDCDYYYGKTDQDKIEADKRFGENMLMTIRFKSWFWKVNPLYYLRRKRTLECYLAVKYGGHKAFWCNKK